MDSSKKLMREFISEFRSRFPNFENDLAKATFYRVIMIMGVCPVEPWQVERLRAVMNDLAK